MLLLGDEDQFRSIGSDTAGDPEGVNVSAVAQLRPRYKRPQRLRPLRVLRVGSLGVTRVGVTNNEGIQATISADVADGHNTQLDASLKLLSEDEPKLLLPNNLEDDDIHIREATGIGLSGFNEQTKKRQVMAGQRQKHARASSPFDEVAAAKELKRRYRTDAMMGTDQAEAGQHQQPSRAPEASSHIPTAKRQKRGTSLSREKGNIDLVNDSGLAAAVPVIITALKTTQVDM